jgi:hypothetical protein
MPAASSKYTARYWMSSCTIDVSDIINLSPGLDFIPCEEMKRKKHHAHNECNVDEPAGNVECENLHEPQNDQNHGEQR